MKKLTHQSSKPCPVTTKHFFNNEFVQKIMCNDCCKELTGWSKSFTKIELYLSILEGILIILLIGILVFLILHFLACSPQKVADSVLYNATAQLIDVPVSPSTPETLTSTERRYKTTSNTAMTLAPGIKCTWSPSVKTMASKHYYEYETSKSHTNDSQINPPSPTEDNIVTKGVKVTEMNINTDSTLLLNEDFIESDQSDGEDAGNTYRSYVMALVKLKPPTGVTFGCILTVISEFWTVTAASCVESIEEVDSLDFFVMMEDYGAPRQGRTHAVADVRVHPQYRSSDRSYDLAALRCENHLRRAALLPTMLDYLLITIGEKLTIIGYGPFRSIDKGPNGRRLRKVYVYSLPSGQCAGGGEAAPRHLLSGAAREEGLRGGGDAAPLCAGAVRARGAACTYCAGTPLVVRDTLLGVMSDDLQCGAACDPQLYVNVASARAWLDSVINDSI